ncbi:MAG: mechanosensitive ion channel [Prevotella sp.]|nr:mechanosensitive ion channel [Prevotella sp.]
MNEIKQIVELLLIQTGLSSELVSMTRHVVLVIGAILLAWFVGWLFKLLIPWVIRLTRRTEAKWDDVVFNERVLRAACQIVPAIIIWWLLPSVFDEYATTHEVLARLTAIYITVMSVRLVSKMIDSLKLLDSGKRTAKQQYMYTVCGVLKIIMYFVAAIVVIAIIVDKNPSTLLAGLGAASAILMLAFQDTIKGLVAGIRLTSNDMVRVGDRITVPSAGADGMVEEITLTTVKVRNFDNTIITVTPQTLVDGSFQNWKGMTENMGRRAIRKVFIDFRSLTLDEEGIPNLTRYREHMEQWLSQQEMVLADKPILVHQLDATPTGLPVEFVFWLKEQNALPYEHAISEIMEYAYAEAAVFGLRIYQQFPEQ